MLTTVMSLAVVASFSIFRTFYTTLCLAPPHYELAIFFYFFANPAGIHLFNEIF
jgi:hypothetical protein